MLDLLFIKYLCESNVINIVIVALLLHMVTLLTYRINTYPYLVIIYRCIFLLNIKDMGVTL